MADGQRVSALAEACPRLRARKTTDRQGSPAPRGKAHAPSGSRTRSRQSASGSSVPDRWRGQVSGCQGLENLGTGRLSEICGPAHEGSEKGFPWKLDVSGYIMRWASPPANRKVACISDAPCEDVRGGGCPLLGGTDNCSRGVLRMLTHSGHSAAGRLHVRCPGR
jgi:hypothetical protein